MKNKLDLPIWQAIKVKDIVDIERAKQSIADMILFDVYVKDSAGGTGKSLIGICLRILQVNLSWLVV